MLQPIVGGEEPPAPSYSQLRVGRSQWGATVPLQEATVARVGAGEARPNRPKEQNACDLMKWIEYFRASFCRWMKHNTREMILFVF